jgi:hypothetical protein
MSYQLPVVVFIKLPAAVYCRLHLAAEEGKLPILNVILGAVAGIDINARDIKGMHSCSGCAYCNWVRYVTKQLNAKLGANSIITCSNM